MDVGTAANAVFESCARPTPAVKEGEGGEAVLPEPGWPLHQPGSGRLGVRPGGAELSGRGGWHPQAWAGPLKLAYNREQGEDEGQHTPPQDRRERAPSPV